jgi:hypothetical protein
MKAWVQEQSIPTGIFFKMDEATMRQNFPKHFFPPIPVAISSTILTNFL